MGNSPAQPVTISITRTVSADRSREAAAWARAGQDLLAGAPGYLGSGWIRPDPESDEWHMLFRFADQASVDAWEKSPERTWWVESARGIVESTHLEKRTGIEGWFEEPSSVEVVNSSPVPPPRWKQMISIFVVFFPLSWLIQATLTPLMASWPLPLRVLATVGIMMPLMTYLFLPAVTRAMRPWLHAHNRKKTTTLTRKV